MKRKATNGSRIAGWLVTTLILMAGAAWYQGAIPIELGAVPTGHLSSDESKSEADDSPIEVNAESPTSSEDWADPREPTDARSDYRFLDADSDFEEIANVDGDDSGDGNHVGTTVAPAFSNDLQGIRDDRLTTAEPGIALASAAVPTEDASSLDLTEIDAEIAAGNDLSALRALSKIYWEQPKHRAAIRDRTERLAESVFFAARPHYAEAYRIQPGDQLRKIAKKYRVSWQYLAALNRVDPRKIRAGRTLKVNQGPFGAVVDLSEFALTVHARGLFVRRYRVGIGKAGATPIGKFTVREKLEDPTYYGPDGEVIANDDPLNPLGERWVDIGDGYGIHGTIEPNSIGKAESRGCIRMLSDDVAEVYNLLTRGSQVIIQR